MQGQLRKIISVASCAALLAPMLPPPASADLSRADYEACQAQDESALHTTIAAISGDALKAGLAKIDARDLVAGAWVRNNLDEIIDKRVDIAIADVKNQSTWSELLGSLTNTETAQKLAAAVAERVYRADTVKVAIEDLATDTAKEIGKTIELASADAAGPLLNCLRAFVGPRYGSAIAAAVATDAGKDVAIGPGQGSGDVSTGAVLKQTSGGLAGATILIVRRQLGNLATRVGQRIAGSVLSRLVSVVAGGVGLVLIAKDIWELRNGVLPIIATEMKASATKDKVKDEITAALNEQVGTHLGEIATSTADNVIGIWQSFKRAHALVLKLAGENAPFRTFVDETQAASLPRLDEVVALIAGSEGEGGVLHRLGDGTLNQAVHIMPTEALEIARDTKSIPLAIAWSELARDKLNIVIENELHRIARPDDFTRASFDRLVALGDGMAIRRLSGVPSAARATLFELDAAKLQTLAKSLSPAELTTFATYLTGLQPDPRERVLAAIAGDPHRMLVLASGRVRDAIVGSADQGAAVDMMLRPSQGFEPRAFLQDAILAWQGRIVPWLIWDKHPAATTLASVLILLVAAWLKRLVLPPGRRDAEPRVL